MINHRRINKQNVVGIDRARQDGFRYIDSLITFGKNISDVFTEVAKPSDYPAIERLTLTEITNSRLYRDPQIPIETAQQIYKQRLKSFFDDDDIDIFVARHLEAGVIGFAVLHKNEIELIAVDRAYQGEGVGRQLVARAEDIARTYGWKTLTVNTQGMNKPAINFYKRLGFKVENTFWDFHK